MEELYWDRYPQLIIIQVTENSEGVVIYPDM